MATISGTSRPGYVWDSTDNVWYPIGTGVHTHDYIPNSIADAKGDLVTASANDTPARLAVGADGETLVADSSTSTGLRYQGSISAGRNFVINGAMDIWQRGATGLGTSTGSYTADRWVLGSSSTTVTRDTDVPTSPYFQYSLKMVGTSDNSIIQRVEASNSTLLAGQTVTFSFYAKRTSGAGALDVRFYYPSATDNFASNTQIGSTVVVSASPSSSWTRYSVTAAIGTNITTGLQILINNTGAATTFFTGAQLELGSVATQFSRAGGTIQGELACAQRYAIPVFRASGIDCALIISRNATTGAEAYLQLPVQMRTLPSASLISGNYGRCVFYDSSFGLTTSNVSSIAIGDGGNYNAVNISVIHGSVAGTYVTASWDTAVNGGFIMLSAEL